MLIYHALKVTDTAKPRVRNSPIENKGVLNKKKFDIRKFRFAIKKQIENESLAPSQSKITNYYK